jgi:hypothetical protein
MTDRREQVEQFFEAYARRSNDALLDPPVEDVDGTVASFAPYFVEASPGGVMGGPNDDSFRKMIPEGFTKYRDVGGKAMRVARVKFSELDAVNGYARVDWEFDYERPKDGRRGTISFQNIYLLNFADGGPRIFAYITPDEAQAMKDHGLI